MEHESAFFSPFIHNSGIFHGLRATWNNLSIWRTILSKLVEGTLNSQNFEQNETSKRKQKKRTKFSSTNVSFVCFRTKIGLFLNETWEGFSERCETFQNEPLNGETTTHFECINVEVYGFQ
jgi:hypothetical protein